ncbi:hypothetical protein MXD58_029950, partial [Frankia sp. AgKG'84/4]|nr:hypothetical protein [Frankia sp. AgKG'84/4]
SVTVPGGRRAGRPAQAATPAVPTTPRLGGPGVGAPAAGQCRPRPPRHRGQPPPHTTGDTQQNRTRAE